MNFNTKFITIFLIFLTLIFLGCESDEKPSSSTQETSTNENTSNEFESANTPQTNDSTTNNSSNHQTTNTTYQDTTEYLETYAERKLVFEITAPFEIGSIAIE